MLPLLYRLLEHLDGERGAAILPYAWAQRGKVWLLEQMG